MTQSILKFVLMVCTSMAINGCQKRTNQPTARKQIKILMESIHDPVLNSGELEHSDKISEHSAITKVVFNPKGQLLNKSRFNDKGNLEWMIEITYDKRGNVVETTTYGSDRSLSVRKISRFDSLNKLMAVQEFDGRGKMIRKQDVSLNSDGHTTCTTYSLANKDFIKTLQIVKDQHGKTLEKYQFTNGLLTHTEINRYNDKGDRIETTEYNPLTQEEIVTQRKYDQHHNVIEAIALKNNLLTAKVISSYDPKNNVTETLTYGIMGNLKRHVRHTYEYDEASNWTKDITFVNNKPVSVTLHRIEYY